MHLRKFHLKRRTRRSRWTMTAPKGNLLRCPYRWIGLLFPQRFGIGYLPSVHQGHWVTCCLSTNSSTYILTQVRRLAKTLPLLAAAVLLHKSRPTVSGRFPDGSFGLICPPHCAPRQNSRCGGLLALIGVITVENWIRGNRLPCLILIFEVPEKTG